MRAFVFVNALKKINANFISFGNKLNRFRIRQCLLKFENFTN